MRMRRVPSQAGGPLWVAPLLLSGCLGSLEDPDRFLGGGRDATTVVPDLGNPEVCPNVLTTILASTQAPKGCAQTNCHTASAMAFGLDLETANLVERLNNQPSSATCGNLPYIDSNNVSNSLLLTKLGPGPYACGGQMPTGAVLTPADISCVTQYIEEALGVADAGTPEDLGVPDPDLGDGDAGVVDGIVFEAEAMTLTSPFESRSEGTASSGMMITQRRGVLNPDPNATNGIGRAVFDFTVPAAGATWVFARVRAATPDSDSFWVRVDDSEFVQWNDLFDLSNGDWAWDDVHDTRVDNEDAVQYMLTAGAHRLEVVFREANAELDRVIITQNPTFTPPN